jgi:hypothetical protein
LDEPILEHDLLTVKLTFVNHAGTNWEALYRCGSLMGGYVTHFSVQCIIPVTDVWDLIIPKMGGWRKAKFTLFFQTQKNV